MSSPENVMPPARLLLAALLCWAPAVLAEEPAPSAADAPATTEAPTTSDAPAASEAPAAVDAPAVPEAPVEPEKPSESAPLQPVAETNCTDRVDEDSDTVTDCGDGDCFGAPECQAGGADENTDAKCSDWVDNDGDTLVDCDDPECEGAGLTSCLGSWATESDDKAAVPAGAIAGAPAAEMDPELRIGTDGDLDGERSNEVCADGIDNDGDGRSDCSDYGCRYDPSVTVCQSASGMRFSVVVGAAAPWLSILRDGVQTESITPGLERLQLRALGSIPLVANSFFLISIRAEATIRTTFAMFQIPLGNGGHYLNLNTGSGGLSAALITSTANQLLLDPAAFVYRAFEQNNGIALEAGGPLVGNLLRYRAFGAGGAGRSTGNVGGQFLGTRDQSFNWSAGAQLQANLIGSFSRFDSPFLYTPVPLTVGALLGARYDQRDAERFPAVNAYFLLRWNRLVLNLENYTKRELDFGSWQTAYVAQVGLLVVPKKLMVAADFGQYVAQPYERASSDSPRLQNEWQARAAVHYYFWKNIGLVSLLYRERHQDPRDATHPENLERQVSLEMQYRY